MSFQIEKGVAIPTAKGPKCGGITYVLKEMEVGDSFSFADSQWSTSLTIYAVAKRIGIKVTVLQDGDNYRCWRVK